MKINRIKNYLKLGMLLFGVSIILTTCERDDTHLESISKSKFETVSIETAKQSFNVFQKTKQKKDLLLYNKGVNTNPFTLYPQWNVVSQKPLNFTDAFLTSTKTLVNREGDFYSDVFFIKLNGRIVSGIHTTYAIDKFENGEVKNGVIYFNDFEGFFLTAYKVTNGKVSHQLIPKERIQKASFCSYLFFQDDDDDCWNTDYLPEGNVFDEVIIIGTGGTHSGGNTDSGDDQNDNDSGGDFEDASDDNSGGGPSDSSGAYSTYLNSLPTEGDTTECPTGYEKNIVDVCVPICGRNSSRNSYGDCDCDEGYEEDGNGNCVQKPCPGDPVPNPEIAPQLGPSGISGGLHNTCSRSGSGCTGNTSRKTHHGVDIKNPYGAPIYAMYDGVATKATQYNDENQVDGAGYHVSITSTIDGETVRLVYFHLQEDSRILGAVSAGDIIGYQGISGNLAVAIKKGYTTSHVHIKAELNGQKTDPLDYFATTIDPQTGQITNPCN